MQKDEGGGRLDKRHSSGNWPGGRKGRGRGLNRKCCFFFLFSATVPVDLRQKVGKERESGNSFFSYTKKKHQLG